MANFIHMESYAVGKWQCVGQWLSNPQDSHIYAYSSHYGFAEVLCHKHNHDYVVEYYLKMCYICGTFV